ncbi:MAG: uroporphyrinogen decarboxylase family protein [Anaerolineae bacterium]|jgi:uroporphyrinogen decarboxylase
MDLLRSVVKMRRPRGRRPDFERFARAITTREPGPVPVGDLFADFETVGNYLGERVLDYSSMAADPDHRMSWAQVRDGIRFIDQTIRFCLGTGWDYAFCFSNLPFPGFTFQLADNTSTEVEGGQRYWLDDNRGPIADWDDFERYAWPTNARAINRMSRLMAKRVPDGMRVMVIPGGVFEWTTWLMGLVPFCYALADCPELVDAVIQRVSDCIYLAVEDLMDEPNIGGIFMGDDLGYASGTIVSPRVLREKFLPQTRRIVDLVHGAGKLFALHTCGNVYEVMGDLIDLGIDAKHSFEDKVMPVEDVYRRWGEQVALIGGVDVHLLASGTEAEVRRRTREILDACGSGGGYVLGTGNSVANYIPLRNYLAMVDEGWRWNYEHYGRSY